MTHGANWSADQTLYCDTVGRAGVAHFGTRCAAAAGQSPQQPGSRYQARTATGELAQMWFTAMSTDDNELAWRLKHEGIHAGEIIAYRAWRVLTGGGWFRSSDRLHSVYRRDYVWHTDEPACGDVRTHGIYSFRQVIRSNEDYGYVKLRDGPLLFVKVKIWGEVIEHEAGYRSQFGKILSLDHGDPELLDKFRKIYRVNHGDPVAR